MPILQSRFLAVINSATDLHQALLKSHSLILRAFQRAEHESADPHQLLQELAIWCDPNALLKTPVPTLLAFQREQAHFKLHGRRNIREAERRRRQRARLGEPGRLLNELDAIKQHNELMQQLNTPPDPEDYAPPPPPFQHRKLSREEQIKLDAANLLRRREGALIMANNHQLPFHRAYWASDLTSINCDCGFVGSFEAWEAHWRLALSEPKDSITSTSGAEVNGLVDQIEGAPDSTEEGVC